MEWALGQDPQPSFKGTKIQDRNIFVACSLFRRPMAAPFQLELLSQTYSNPMLLPELIYSQRPASVAQMKKLLADTFFFQPTHCFNSPMPAASVGFVPLQIISITVTQILTLTPF